MTYLVLARKYRPQTFLKIVGQNHVTQTLKNAVLNNRVAHSMLLSGPRGTGKTTLARILAKALNCKDKLENRPCNKCKSCLNITNGKEPDVFEIDGASNNSVDQIRNLQENVRYLPANIQLKIYIIDEVHMLSNAAFNALLKTLEEPPNHVIFILATTEYNKIPATIISRCQHHNLKRIKTLDIQKHLLDISKLESFDISIDNLWTISNKADGSIRDALSLLDQVVSFCDKNINNTQLLDILGIVDRQLMHNISGYIFSKETNKVLKTIDDIYAKGYDLKSFYYGMLEHFRHLLLLKIDKNSKKMITLPSTEIKKMEAQIEEINITLIDQVLSILSREELYIKNSNNTKLATEITFLKLHNIQSALSIDSLIEKLDDFKKIKNNLNTVKTSNKMNETQTISKPKQNINLDKIWKQVCNSISKTKPSLSTNLHSCSLSNKNNKHLIINITKDTYTLKTIEKNFSFIKEKFKKYYGDSTIISIQNNIKKNTTTSEQTSQKKISKHPLIVDTLKTFNGKIEEIKINNNEKEYYSK